MHPACRATVPGRPRQYRFDCAIGWRRANIFIEAGVEIAIDGGDLGEKRRDPPRVIGKIAAQKVFQLRWIFRKVQAQTVLNIAMEDTAPTDAAFRTHGGEKPSQRSVRAKTTDVLYAGIEYETPNASVAAPHSPCPRGAV